MGHASHWQSVYEDIGAFVDDELPALVKRLSIIADEEWAGPPRTYEDVTPTRLLYLSETDGDMRHLLIVAKDDASGRNTLVTTMPFCCAGFVHDVTLTAIDEAENGIEARLSGMIGESARVTFLDPLYAINRAAYEIGKTYPFRLSALAYDLRAPDRNHVEITDPARSLEVRRMLRAAGGEADDSDEPLRLKLAGAAMMFPLEDWQPDDYSFYAPVREVRSCLLSDRTIIELQITPLRLDNRDYDIVLYAAAHRIKDDLKPGPGLDVTGAFWLQGHLAD